MIIFVQLLPKLLRIAYTAADQQTTYRVQGTLRKPKASPVKLIVMLVTRNRNRRPTSLEHDTFITVQARSQGGAMVRVVEYLIITVSPQERLSPPTVEHSL